MCLRKVYIYIYIVDMRAKACIRSFSYRHSADLLRKASHRLGQSQTRSDKVYNLRISQRLWMFVLVWFGKLENIKSSFGDILRFHRVHVIYFSNVFFFGRGEFENNRFGFMQIPHITVLINEKIQVCFYKKKTVF